MAQNFIACDREQELLLPPSLREWLPEDHLAWFVLDAVDAMNLKAFFVGYREDGWGGRRTIAGGDVVELLPSRDVNGLTALTTTRLLMLLADSRSQTPHDAN
jgi:hypothetical protein